MNRAATTHTQLPKFTYWISLVKVFTIAVGLGCEKPTLFKNKVGLGLAHN